MLRRLAALILGLALALNGAAAWWALARSPFARPLVELSAQAARARIDRAMAARATPDWLAAQGEAALAAGDEDRMNLVLEVAQDQGMVLPRDLLLRMQDWVAANTGPLHDAADCARCAMDVAACRSIAVLGACGLAVQLTPVGDVAALWRFAAAEVSGGEVDWIDAGLGAVGVAATAGILLTGGSSYTIKAGASVLRTARRLGTLSTRLSTRLVRLGREAVDWRRLGDVLAGRAALRDMVDAARMTELSRLAGALGTVREQTSLAETLHLLRYVDDVGDAEDLARVARAKGGRTRHALEVLGKPRTFRLLRRVSDMALLTCGLLATLAASLASAALHLLLKGLRALLRPRRSRRVARRRQPPALRRGTA